MRKTFTILILSIVLTYSCLGQSYKDNRKEADRIKSDTSYYWGESESFTSLDAADDKAIENLIDNISSRYKSYPVYFSNAGDEDEQLNRIYKTYKKLIETSSRQIILQQKSETAVFRCIDLKDIREIFRQRQNDINYYVEEGLDAEGQGNIGDALCNFYWSMMLCHSHPNGNRIMMQDSDNFDELTPTYRWLTKRIDMILNDINVIPKTSMKEDDMLNVELSFQYMGNFVNNVRYEYNDGSGMIVNTVNNGKSLVQLRDKKMKTLHVRFELEYENEAENFNKDVYNVMQILNRQIHFNSANKTITLGKVVNPEPEVVAEQNPAVQAEIKEREKLFNSIAIEDNVYLKSMKIIEKAIREKRFEDARDCFTEDGYNMLMELSKYGSISIIGKPEYKFLDFNGEVICRSIPMQFNFKTNDAGFNQDVVFRFDNQSNKVSSVAFRLGETAERDILGKGTWDRKSRVILIKFLEDYQTAYALKRLEYLDKIFSDNALIIIGIRVENAPVTTDGPRLIDKEQYEYVKKSKETYIKDLRRAFNSKEYINLRFTETEFTKSTNGKELYGVEIKQNYYSSSYDDIGYLFLIVDLSKELPLIHVRTWQPDKTDSINKINFDDFEWN